MVLKELRLKQRPKFDQLKLSHKNMSCIERQKTNLTTLYRLFKK
ncbi:hypothetical protein FWK35_00021698 [Aphis craccivora]|uniref:Uncharacterized protein n=1 Tax=Aphis craccivora TaxID=307492 RepID=A0A6G0ZJD1_APHCR|nr:hypothetical protein FWK35_00021698 [Aphis craccivora]